MFETEAELSGRPEMNAIRPVAQSAQLFGRRDHLGLAEGYGHRA